MERDPGAGAKRPSAKERAHFAAVAQAMAREKQEQIVRAARDRMADGILVGLALACFAADTPTIRALEERRAEEQVELRRRWLRLRGRQG